MLHDPDAERRALVGDAGAQDELNGFVVEDFALAARELRLRIALGERRQQIGLLGEDRHELPTASHHRVHLAVDVRVVDSDDRELDLCWRRRGRRGL